MLSSKQNSKQPNRCPSTPFQRQTGAGCDRINYGAGQDVKPGRVWWQWWWWWLMVVMVVVVRIVFMFVAFGHSLPVILFCSTAVVHSSNTAALTGAGER